MKFGDQQVDLTSTKLMGVLNVTPDSFSDGGLFYAVDVAVKKGLLLEKAGAHFVDIGGESSRPGAIEISIDEEIRRVVPVIKALRQSLKPSTILSIDTRNRKTAEAAVLAGARLVNDISAMNHDASMIDFIAESQVAICLMHMRDKPSEMNWSHSVEATQKYRYANVVQSVLKELKKYKEKALNAGIAEHQIILDVGLGFGKTLTQNFELLAHIEDFKELGSPILVGASRKSFIGELIGQGVEDRLAGSLAVSDWCVTKKVEIIRVHDVRETQDMIAIKNKILDSFVDAESKT